MKKRFMTAAVVGTLIASTTMSSCIGSFGLTNKLLDWNHSIDNKFVNELVFLVFWIVPVYPVSALADMLVLNSIEFWTGESPLTSSTVIEGNDGKYLVERDPQGYTITSLNDKSVVRFNFDSDEQTWSVTGIDGEEYPLMTFVDDTHVKVNVGNGEMMLVEKSEAGLYAYQQMVLSRTSILASK